MATESTITVKASGTSLTMAALRQFLEEFDKSTPEGGYHPGFHDGSGRRRASPSAGT